MKKIGVLQPVYNVDRFVAKSIESILEQTFKDFLYVIVDDGSTDNTLNVVKEYEKKDDRMVVLSKEHSGLVDSLNEGLSYLADKCEFIARMDGDDFCERDRFEKQLDFLEKNDLKFCSTWMRRYDKKENNYENFCPRFESPSDFKEAMLKMNFVVHGSVMFSSEIVKEIGLYPDEIVEDYNYWMAILNKFDGNVLPEYLYHLNDRDGSYTDEKGNLIYNEAKKCRFFWSNYWNIDIPTKEYNYKE